MIPSLILRTLFLSTLSLRRATSYSAYLEEGESISIHALLAESDKFQNDRSGQNIISIHALLAESDVLLDDFFIAQNHFYPRSPCGERPVDSCSVCSSRIISIHALLAESDPGGPRPPAPPRHFYPRSPCGERPGSVRGISSKTADFYPRSPCGERHDLDPSKTRRLTFLSTLSLRRATLTELLILLRAVISIHALLAESDVVVLHIVGGTRKFLSTLSLRRATQDKVSLPPAEKISIHALLAESDRISQGNKLQDSRFLSTLSLRRATSSRIKSSSIIIYFYPRSPCGERQQAQDLKIAP